MLTVAGWCTNHSRNVGRVLNNQIISNTGVPMSPSCSGTSKSVYGCADASPAWNEGGREGKVEGVCVFVCVCVCVTESPQIGTCTSVWSLIFQKCDALFKYNNKSAASGELSGRM